MELSQDISQRLSTDASLILPTDILQGVVVTMDAALVTVTSGKVQAWGGQYTQSDAAKRADYIAVDPDFNGNPSADFLGVETPQSGSIYPLGNLSAYTQAEMYVVLKLASASPVNPISGGWRIGTGNQDHYGYTNGRIYDSFASTLRRDLIDPAPVNLAATHIYNCSSRANEWILRLNGAVTFSDASNTVALNTACYFGGDTFISMDGKVAYAVICSQVQTAAARAAMHRYLAARFGVAL